MPKIKEENKEETVVVIAVKSTYYLIDLMTGQRRIARVRVRLKKKNETHKGSTTRYRLDGTAQYMSIDGFYFSLTYTSRGGGVAVARR